MPGSPRGTRATFVRWLAPSAFVSLALLAGCDRPPSDEKAVEWTAKDHDRIDESRRVNTGAQAAASPRATAAAGAGNDARALANLAWQSQCAVCHGAAGRGDGPNGPMVKAPDMSRPEWQDKLTDEGIVTAIRQGKGLMPKFELPEATLRALVGHVRGFRSP